MKSSISSRNPVVPAPAPDQRDRGRELEDLVRVEVVRDRAVRVRPAAVAAEVDRAVRDDLVDDHARAVAELVGDVAQRPQVVLDRLELAERDRRVRGVLAVDAEQPRVVRVAGADPAHPRQRADVGPLLALVRPAQVEPGRLLREVGEVLLAPLDRVLQLRVAGQPELRPARELPPRALLLAQRAGRVTRQPRAARSARRPASRPTRRRRSRATASRPRAAGSRSVSRPPVPLPNGPSSHCFGSGSGFCGRAADAARAVRAVVARADRAADRLAIRADHRGVGVRSGLARELPGVAEDQPAARVGAGVGRVVARVGHDAVKPHGYWPISSECASTWTRTVRARCPGCAARARAARRGRRPAPRRCARRRCPPCAGGRSGRSRRRS